MNLLKSIHFTLQRLTDGVYAAIHTEGGGAIGNAGIIDLGDRTLLFDTFMYPSAAKDLRAAAETLFGRPVSIVVNSHVDQDHVFGNQVFPEAVICASDTTRVHFGRHAPYLKAELERLSHDIVELERQLAEGIPEETQVRETLGEKMERQREFGAVTPTWPTCCFADAIAFHGPARSVNVFTHGGGHSVSDAMLYLPGERVLFTGDLVTVGHHPYLVEGDPDQWLRILDQVDHLAVDLLVPGHGPLGTMADLRTIRQYITDLQALAPSEVDAAAHLPVPAAYAHWAWSFLFGVNRRFVAERRSERLQP